MKQHETAQNGTLTSKQEKTLLALLSEPTLQAAADTAQVGLRTLHTWLKEEKFAAAYREVRREAVGQSIARLQQAAGDAVDTLKAIMTDPGAKAAARVTAARTVLEFALHVTELEDLQSRIEHLEKQVNT